MRPKKSNPRIFVSAGEASGDHYGAQLIHAIQLELPQAIFTGLGGVAMESAGQQRVIRAEDVAVMGITEILRHIPHIYASYRKLVDSIRRNPPDVAVLIDFPDVNFRLARELKKLNVPVVYFVSPQLWAWKKRRLRWVQERVTRMLVIFPFEETFYQSRGVDAEFVGHPLAELPLPTIAREEYATLYDLSPAQSWVALLPGSRRKEVDANLPTMLEAAALLTKRLPECQFLLPVANTLDPAIIQQHIQPALHPRIQLVPDAREALFHAAASVVASGTATVQAALIGNPFIVVYKVSPLTFRLAKKLVSYPPEIPAPIDVHGNLPIAMVNLIAGRRIVPELLQEQFTPAEVARQLQTLLEDEQAATTMRDDLTRLRQRVRRLPTEITAIQRVKDAVLQLLP